VQLLYIQQAHCMSPNTSSHAPDNHPKLDDV
jgi:hypothetical protein